MPAPNPRHFGWLPDKPDPRDLRYRTDMGEVPFWAEKVPPCLAARLLPETADLFSYGTLPPIYDQGAAGSCTGQALGAAVHFMLAKDGETPDERGVSRLFLYYHGRFGVPEDTGASIRDVVKGLAKHGACQEELHPHNLRLLFEMPSEKAYDDAAPRSGVRYARLSGLNDMLGCLASGHPFIFGMALFEEFFALNHRNAVVPMPKAGAKPAGYHAVMAGAYNRKTGLVECRNSWGAGWGKAGHFFLPFSYLERRDLCADAWTLRSVPVV